MMTCGGGTRWRRWVLLGVGLVLVVGAFGAFAFLGVGRSSYELCVSDSVVELESASRVWLPVVGSSCTYAPSDDVHVVMVVFDGAASAFAIAGWVLIGAAFYSRRRQPPSELTWSMPVDRE
ncbi:hypothetical protein [Rhodococcus erythropolis]|uniref:Transmembrane protein n=1 Tax=Rhodococcus erythropolis TaxID=1833 RepID=A0AAX3ZZA4_RHOER|nr:hypothetical protein [Rhodococcus erythropolis]WMN03076.1 hypothetical protein QIE55_32220 [Rhodococcus erythropolis]